MKINYIVVLICSIIFVWGEIGVVTSDLFGSNYPPDVDGISTHKPDVALAGDRIKWSAIAYDLDGDTLFFRFLVNGTVVRDWSEEGKCIYIPSNLSAGTNIVEVQVRDGKHAGRDNYDDNFVTELTVKPRENPIPEISIYEDDSRIYLSINNWNMYNYDLFKSAPRLPPCGLNKNSSRSWVEVYDQNYKQIYGWCSLSAPESLKDLSFGINNNEIDYIYLDIIDREYDVIYRSNLIPLHTKKKDNITENATLHIIAFVDDKPASCARIYDNQSQEPNIPIATADINGEKYLHLRSGIHKIMVEYGDGFGRCNEVIEMYISPNKITTTSIQLYSGKYWPWW